MVRLSVLTSLLLSLVVPSSAMSGMPSKFNDCNASTRTPLGETTLNKPHRSVLLTSGGDT
jgi:hypothetical protein